MSHIHIADGILPIWLWLFGFIFVGIYLIFASFYFKKHGLNKRVPLVGVIAALMLITMSIEIIPPAYHMNFAALSGIMLGPVLSIMAILVTNIILAFLGHGGITVIGLNTLTVSLEAILGFWGFKLLYSKLKNIFISVFIASLLALFLSAWSSIGIVYMGTHNPSEIFEHHHEEIHSLHSSESPKEKIAEHNHVELDTGKFILAVLSLGILGWVIESLVTSFIINYISKIKPDIIEQSTGIKVNI